MSRIGFSHLPVSCDQADTTAVTMWVMSGGGDGAQRGRSLSRWVGEGLRVRRAYRGNGPTVFTTHKKRREKKSLCHFGTLYLITSHQNEEVFGLS